MSLATAAPLFPFLPAAANAALGWVVAAAVVVAGLLVYGLTDLQRFSVARTWSLSSVSFRDAVRRRVLWVAPLAMLGVVIVTQLINPTDELDAVRQTIQYCLFATGLVVIVVTIILGCTSLPREIESRVIYTIVTKPTTRFEILVGKLLGYARVSALILLLMGAFTWAYVGLRAWSLRGDIDAKLEARIDDPARLAWLEHFRGAGLLSARDLVAPTDYQVYARLPDLDPDGQGQRRYLYAAPMDFIVPFRLTADQLAPALADPDAEPAEAGKGATLRLFVGYERFEADDAPEPALPSPLLPTDPAERVPSVRVELLDATTFLLPDGTVNGGAPLPLPPDPTGATPLDVPITPQQAKAIGAVGGQFFARVTGAQPGFLYAVGPELPAQLVVPAGAPPAETTFIEPAVTDAMRTAAHGGGAAAILRGGEGRNGMQVAGPKGARQQVAVFRFPGGRATPVGGVLPVEVRVGIEHDGDDDSIEPTVLEVSARNRATGQLFGPELVYPEAERTAYVALPAAAAEGGDYDVILRTRTPGDVATIDPNSVAVVAGREPFAWNLLKGLGATWLLSVLVVAVALFTSTFVSWPIAVVLTLVILLGNWAVGQLGGALGPGIGRQIGGELFSSPAQTEVATGAIDALTGAVAVIGRVLPDLSAFAASDFVARGVSVPAGVFGRSLLVLIVFGLPLITLAYVFLRNKEVAP